MTRVIRADQRGPRVVAHEIADATEQARAIVAQARQHALDILERAEHTAARAAEQAAHDARAQALEQGRAALETSLQALHDACGRAHASLEPHVIEIAMLAAKHVLASELDARPAAIGAVVRPLLERVRRAHSLRLRVHPADAEWLSGSLAALQRESGIAARLQLEADPELARGGCVVVSDIGVLDARIETRLGVLQDMLRRTHPDGQ